MTKYVIGARMFDGTIQQYIILSDEDLSTIQSIARYEIKGARVILIRLEGVCVVEAQSEPLNIA